MLFVQHALLRPHIDGHDLGPMSSIGKSAPYLSLPVRTGEWLSTRSLLNGFTDDETAVCIPTLLPSRPTRSDISVPAQMAVAAASVVSQGLAADVSRGTPPVDSTVMHVRYGTTREKHCHLNFSDFCATVHVIALRRYGGDEVGNSISVSPICRVKAVALFQCPLVPSVQDRDAIQAMLVHSLLPLAERIGKEISTKSSTAVSTVHCAVVWRVALRSLFRTGTGVRG